MSQKGELLEWDVDIHALQHFSQDPPGTPGGSLLIDGVAYPPVGDGDAHVIQNDGSDMTARSNLNFSGNSVSVTDNSGNDATDIAINAPVTSVNGATGVVVLDPDDLDDSAAANKFNQTHTGQVTGATALTLSKTAISDQSEATPANEDYLLAGDSSDSDNLKKVLVSGLPLNRPVTTLTDAATIAVDASAAHNGIFKATLAGNRTMGAPSGSPTDGQTIEFWIKQDATGSRTITWNSIYLFCDTVAEPTLSTTANYTDIVCFQYNSTLAKWMCTAALLGYAG